MRRTGERGKRRRPGGRRPMAGLPLCLLPSGFCLLALAGCAGDNRVTDDPLLGDERPRPAAQAGVPPPAASAVPPLPPSNTATSTASLAGGNPLPGGRELRIGETPGRLVNNNTWDGPGRVAANPPPKEANGAVLQHPEPITPAAGKGPE